MLKLNVLYIWIIAMCLFSSCDSESDTDVNLDILLSQTLDDAANGLGKSHFKLPSSSDFANIPQDPNNPLTKAKVALGQLLFHESAFATAGEFPITVKEYSCASCHHAAAGFQSGLRQGIGEGGKGFGVMGEGRIKNAQCDVSLVDVQPLRSPSILNSGYQLNMLWNGQFGATGDNVGTEDRWKEGTPIEFNHEGFEGVEIQAIAGLGVHRMKFNQASVEENDYTAFFDAAFPDIPTEERYTNLTAGLAIAAYERTVLSNQSPFQKYLKGNKPAMSEWEKEGAILFFGKAKCVNCHTGPSLNKMEFHALGMNEFNTEDVFRFDPTDGARFGRFSFSGIEADKFKFKTPQLYNIRDGRFYGHGASFDNIQSVVEYKNNGVVQNSEATNISPQFVPLGLTNDEVLRITAFLENGLYDPNLERYLPETLPSGNCFPNNDQTSALDIGCK